MKVKLNAPCPALGAIRRGCGMKLIQKMLKTRGVICDRLRLWHESSRSVSELSPIKIKTL
jgi:hypothetical protein